MMLDEELDEEEEKQPVVEVSTAYLCEDCDITYSNKRQSGTQPSDITITDTPVWYGQESPYIGTRWFRATQKVCKVKMWSDASTTSE